MPILSVTSGFDRLQWDTTPKQGKESNLNKDEKGAKKDANINSDKLNLKSILFRVNEKNTLIKIECTTVHHMKVRIQIRLEMLH